MMHSRHSRWAWGYGNAALLLFAAAASATTPSFKSPQPYTVGTAPVAAVVVDLNNDGKPDIAVANSGSSNVSILLGSGDGSFKAASNFDAGLAPSGIAVADLDGDGKLDIAAFVAPNGDTSTPGAISILLGNGNGTFQAPMVTTLTVHESVVAVVDVNGDKKADLIVNVTDSNFSPAGVAVLLGNGDGTFQTPKTIASGVNGLSTVADFNNDGKPDLAVNTSTSVQVLYGNGDGTFTQGPQASPSDGGTPGRAWAFDVNGDNVPDLIVDSAIYQSAGDNSSITQSVGVFLSGGGQFGSEEVFATGSSSSFEFGTRSNTLITDIAAGDFDGDGNGDIANRANHYAFGGKSTSNPACALNLGNGAGNFTVVPMADPGRLGAAADVNGDQLTDLIVLDAATNSIAVLVNSTPAFSMTPSATTLTASAGQQIADTLTFAALNGFSSTLQLTCQVTGPQPAPSCSLSPASVTKAAGTSTLTINVPSTQSGLVPLWPSRYLYALGLAVGFLGFISKGKSRAAATGRRAILMSTLLFLIVGCGGGGSSSQMQSPQQYTVEVTAKSDTLTKALQISLTAP